MRLYLGNTKSVFRDYEDNDVILVKPCYSSKGDCHDIKQRSAFRVHVWKGLKKEMKYFKYDNANYDDIKAKAQKYLEENNTNSSTTIIQVLAKDVTDNVLKNFRYVEPYIDYPEQPLEIDPYFFGLWLGDGNSHNTGITNVDKVIIEYVYEYARTLNLYVTDNSRHTYSIVSKKGSTNSLLEKLKSLNVLKNKHIPEVYLKNSKDNRLRLLAGILDTDGNLARGYYEITQKSEPLTNDLLTLVNSLGFFARCDDKIAYAANTEAKTRRTYKRTHIYLDDTTPYIPCLIPHKQYDTTATTNFSGTKMFLDKPSACYRKEWTPGLKDLLRTTAERYKKNGRIPWSVIVKEEEAFKEFTPECLRAEYTVMRL